MSEELSVATNSHPSLSPILLHHHQLYVSVVMKKTQSLKIAHPIKKNGPDDDRLGLFWALPLRHRRSELDDKQI
jgi:hypothetical protein